MCDQAERVGGLFNRLNHTSRHSGGWYVGNMLGFDLKTVGGGAFAGNAEEGGFHLGEELFADMATFHQQTGAAGNDVERPRLDLNIADVENAVAVALAHHVVTAYDEQRRAAQRIAPLVHIGRAGMPRLPVEGQQIGRAPDDPGDRADVDRRRGYRRALCSMCSSR